MVMVLYSLSFQGIGVRTDARAYVRTDSHATQNFSDRWSSAIKTYLVLNLSQLFFCYCVTMLLPNEDNEKKFLYSGRKRVLFI